MNVYSTTSFRTSVLELTKKSKYGYTSVISDICKALNAMPDSVMRDTNDRIKQYDDFRIVKLRIPNSGQKLSKSDGFRLIYWVSTKKDNLVLLKVYPKRGALSRIDLENKEYLELLKEFLSENQQQKLHKTDIKNSLTDISDNAFLE